jgi:hypothetical protein
MKPIPTLAAASVPAVVVALLFASSARAADEGPHRLGDHPAIIVQRLHKAAGYDYASKFYPHPAGLRLYAETHAEPRGEAAPPTAGGFSESRSASAQRPVARESAASPKLDARSGG